MKAIMKITLLMLLLALPSACLGQAPVRVAPRSISDLPLERIEGEIRRAAQSAGGTVGVSAIHIESGRRVALNAGERFPMASTYKIPIAVQFLARVDQ